MRPEGPGCLHGAFWWEGTRMPLDWGFWLGVQYEVRGAEVSERRPLPGRRGTCVHDAVPAGYRHRVCAGYAWSWRQGMACVGAG